MSIGGVGNKKIRTLFLGGEVFNAKGKNVK